VAGVQGVGLQDQARGEQALPLRDHELAADHAVAVIFCFFGL
jgi:hypothetical protein